MASFLGTVFAWPQPCGRAALKWSRPPRERILDSGRPGHSDRGYSGRARRTESPAASAVGRRPVPAHATPSRRANVTFKVDKFPLPVRLAQPQQEPLDGALMLFRHGRIERQETVLELLNSNKEVI